MQGASKVLLVLIVVVVVFLATSACADEQDDGPASAEREKAQFFQHRSVDSAQDDRQSEQGFRNRRIEALRHVIEQRRSQLQDRKRGEGSVSGVRATSSSSSTQRTTTAMASTTASTTTTSEAAMKTMAPFQTPLPLDLKALAMSTCGPPQGFDLVSASCFIHPPADSSFFTLGGLTIYCSDPNSLDARACYNSRWTAVPHRDHFETDGNMEVRRSKPIRLPSVRGHSKSVIMPRHTQDNDNRHT